MSFCLTKDTIKSLLLHHAFSGCDTTSSFFGHGKNDFFYLALLVYNSQSKIEEIISAGEKLILLLYGGSTKDSLNSLRCKRYQQFLFKNKVLTKGIDPKRFPPTTGSAAYHSLRVYHQWRF